MKRLREFEERQERRLTGRNVCSCGDDSGSSTSEGESTSYETSNEDARQSGDETVGENVGDTNSYGGPGGLGSDVGGAGHSAEEEAARDAYFANLNEKGLADPNEFENKGNDPVTGRSQEEQFQYDADANNKGQGVNESGQTLAEALAAGTYGFDAKSAASTFGKASSLAGPVVGGVAAVAHGLVNGYTPGVGFSSKESEAAINAANQQTSQAVGNTGAVAAANNASAAAAQAAGGIGADNGSNGGGESSASPGPVTTAGIVASNGISAVAPTVTTPATTTQKPPAFAEQLWWGGRKS